MVDAYNLVFAALLLAAGSLATGSAARAARRLPASAGQRGRRPGIARRADRARLAVGVCAALIFPVTLSVI